MPLPVGPSLLPIDVLDLAAPRPANDVARLQDSGGFATALTRAAQTARSAALAAAPVAASGLRRGAYLSGDFSGRTGSSAGAGVRGRYCRGRPGAGPDHPAGTRCGRGWRAG